MLATVITSSTSALAGRRSREDAEQIVKAWHNGLPEKEIYIYDRYIADNTALTERIADLCSYNCTGVRYLFGAMPGCGKTYFSCKGLVKLINQKTNYHKTVVLAVPNNIQCWQNRTSYGTYAVAGDSDDKFKRKHGLESKGYTAVYECVAELATWPATELKDYVLIIDEAHQLMTECDYRTFEGIMAAADEVVTAGGVVMWMTATPRPILHLWPYNAWIVAERKDSAKTNVQTIDFESVNTRKVKVFDAVLDEIRKLQKSGRMAVVRYQSKDKIEQARKILEAEGIKCEILTADCKEKTRESDGNLYYKSQVYAGLIESGTLPDVDVLLCTSILEVGTSIVGIDRGRKVVQDAGLTPIFVCQRADTNLDRMIQFFARFRFPISEAKIICAKCQSPTDYPVDLTQGADALMVKNAVSLYMQRDRLATAFSKDLFRRYLKSWHGHTDGQGLTADGKIDFPLIWADAIQKYFGLVYRQNGAAQTIISNEFGVPVTVREVSSLEQKRKLKKDVKISAEAKEAFRVLMADDKVYTALAGDERDIKKNPAIKAFIETHPDCAKVMFDAIKPYAACAATMPVSLCKCLAVYAALAKAEHPRVAEKNTSINPATNMLAFYYDMLAYPASVAEQILDAAAGLIDKPTLPDYMADDVKAWHIVWDNRPFTHEIGGKKYDDFLTMWRIFRLIDTKARYEKFKKITRIFATSDAETARRVRYDYSCVHLNRTERKGLYSEVACPDASYVAAEHTILTHPERYLYRAYRKDGKLDSRYTDTLRWFQNAAEELTYSQRLNKGTFIGKELTSMQIQTIAEGFGASISKLAGKAGIHGDRYTAEDIYWMIQSAYTVAFVKGRDEVVKQPKNFEAFEELGKIGVKMKIRGYRMNLPHGWTCLMQDTTAEELERERVQNILVRNQERKYEPQPHITLHPMLEPEPEVIAKQEIQTVSKIESENGISQETLKKIN